MADKNVKITITAEGDNAQKALKGIGTALTGVEKGAKSASKSISVEFIKAAAVIQGLKMAFKFAADGVKEFEKAAGGGGLTKMQKGLKEIQMQVGSVLSKEFEKLSVVFEKNRDKILRGTQQIVEGFLGLVDVLSGAVMWVFNSIEVAIGQISEAAVSGFASIIDFINGGLKMLPPGLVPKGWIESLDQVSTSAKVFAQSLNEEFSSNADAMVSATNKMANGIKRIGMAVSGKGIVITNVMPEDKDASSRAKAEHDIIVESFRSIAEEKLRQNAEVLDSEMDYLKKVEVGWANNTEVLIQEVTRRANIVAASQSKDYQLKLEAIEYSRKEELSKEELTAAAKAAINAKWDNKAEAARLRHVNEGFALDTTINKEVERVQKEAESRRAEISDIGRNNEISQMSSMFQQQIANTNDFYDDQQKIVKKGYDDGVISEEKFNQMIIDSELTRAEKVSQIRQDAMRSQIEMMATWSQQVTQLGTTVADIEINQIERRRDADLRALEAQNWGAEYSARKREEINDEYDAKVRQQKKKQQKWAIASAIISGGIAVMGAWENAMKLSYPLNIIAGVISSGLITALTIAETAKISSQEFAKGGVVQGNPALGDVQNARLTGGEVVLNRNQQANLLMGMANGSVGRTQSSGITMGDINITVQGNADEATLTRVMKRSRQTQMHDMKMLLREMQYTGVARLQVA